MVSKLALCPVAPVAVIVLPSELTAETGASTNDAPVPGAAAAQRFVDYYHNLSNIARVAVSSGRLSAAAKSFTTNTAASAPQREAASLVPGGQSNGQADGRAAGHQKGHADALGIMKRSLSLNDDQTSKLEPVLKEQRDKINALRRNTVLSRQERVAKLREIQQGTDSKIKAVLTPEEAEQWHRARASQRLFLGQPGQGASRATPLSVAPQGDKAPPLGPNPQSGSPQPEQAPSQAPAAQTGTPR